MLTLFILPFVVLQAFKLDERIETAGIVKLGELDSLREFAFL